MRHSVVAAGLEYEFRPYLASVTLSADSIFSCEGEGWGEGRLLIAPTRLHWRWSREAFCSSWDELLPTQSSAATPWQVSWIILLQPGKSGSLGAPLGLWWDAVATWSVAFTGKKVVRSPLSCLAASFMVFWPQTQAFEGISVDICWHFQAASFFMIQSWGYTKM